MNPADVSAAVRDHVRSISLGEATGHDWWHVVRVAGLSAKICEAEGGDPLRVELTALLHDVFDEKFYSGDAGTALSGLVDQLGVRSALPDEVWDGIIYDILHLGFAGGFDQTPLSLEGQIVQDADRLDAIGAIGIARAFAYGGAKGRELYNPDEGVVTVTTAAEYRTGSRHTVNHFSEKLLLLRDRMNTDTAREIAQRRHRFMEEYLAEFFAEWEGAVSYNRRDPDERDGK
ncbi:MAG: HD domain-containing protein [Methanocorpusculum sp.]|nr:HD domain-containing protein [Methanocorpusculum sp.]